MKKIATTVLLKKITVSTSKKTKMKQLKDISTQLKDLTCLYEITKNLASSTDLRECLSNAMKTIDVMKNMENGTVTIINPITGKLEIEVAHGISAEGRKRGKYQIGEGITGKVVASGESIIVPHIADEPMFLNKTRARGDLNTKARSFICVPIHGGKQVIGALSVDRVYLEGISKQADDDLRFLTILSSLIAQTTQRIQTVSREQEDLIEENLKLRRELSGKNTINDIQGNSSRMQEVYEMIHRVVDSNATVLLRGESGTGKTLVAKALHYNSKRSNKQFVVVNCSALPETLLESELFGHEKGAFTGATERKTGRFEQAEGGTLFLDEIGEISQAVQVKLLNVVQERTFQRLGSGKSIQCDVRLVAATNRDLEAAVRDNSFREDLYYRLNVFPVYMPALRERRTDILLLAEYFLKKYSDENKVKINRISTTAIDMLIQYHWPGNVRELQNCMERAVLICDGDTIKGIHLPPTLQTSDSTTSDKNPLSLSTAVENFEKDLIIEALKKTRGNQTKASKILDTSLRIINYKIHQYNIDPKKFKITP
ncbi:GAF, AAA-type ATPase, and DNA binding domain-containing transcriptional regulator [Desulfocapsa sulfexigens DSM 10523]|uniref:GAF, AAA-type ATPase, and DNA binding domain-containing transcriptional regulator n=2 Tax=Desulfocapsa TaxID=53318 RepID=M1P7J3_DESSD|nr:sigma 54-interacting transcriptional regulator [Desulfocapsa sulfexigens]AGF77667.1 GAF, AAA-type ATPase, and DNA binding domain-containing transcriptional regulator [Desulfocapsa sulfexigens DSM 10523]